MNKEIPSGVRACAHCGQAFVPDPRVGERQRFCSRLECRRASRRLSQAKWLNKPENHDYHRGPEQVQRNRLWRQAHPDYRRQQRRRRKQQVRLQRVLSSELSAALISCGLQNLNDRQLALMLGLVERVCPSGQQDQMAASLRRLMFDGYALLSSTKPP